MIDAELERRLDRLERLVMAALAALPHMPGKSSAYIARDITPTPEQFADDLKSLAAEKARK